MNLKLVSTAILLALSGCNFNSPDVERSGRSKEYASDCDSLCLKKFGTGLDFVGSMSGTCLL